MRIQNFQHKLQTIQERNSGGPKKAGPCSLDHEIKRGKMFFGSIYRIHFSPSPDSFFFCQERTQTENAISLKGFSIQFATVKKLKSRSEGNFYYSVPKGGF
jgi:hypothetical protein